MHTIGKVFLGLIVVFLVPAAVLLSARLINTRNHWMQTIGNEEKAIADSEANIAKLRAELVDERARFTRQRLSWDTMRVAPRTGADANGVLSAGIGPQQGFAVQTTEDGAPPIIHAFMPQADGTSMYVGPFQVTAAQNSQTQLKPLFAVGAGEAQNWNQGIWRFWDVIPAHAGSRVVEMTNEIVKEREALASRRITLERQQAAVTAAQSALQTRQMELLGNPQAPEIENLPEVKAGLVATLQSEESLRAQELAQLDQLRHAIDRAYERLNSLVEKSRQRVGQISQSPQDESSLDLSAAR